MRIGIDGATLGNRRGYGRFLKELLPPLVAAAEEGGHEVSLYAEEHRADQLALPEGARLRPVACRVTQSEAASADGYRPVRDLLRFRAAVASDAPEVFFFPSVYSWFPLPRRVPTLLGVHDAIAERFPQLCFATRRARLFWTLKVRLALRQARRVLTVSEFSRQELIERLKIAPERVFAVDEAPAAVYAHNSGPAEIGAARERAGVPSGDSWFTYVGGFNPHKRLDVLLRAHAKLIEDGGARAHLVLVGTRDKDVFHGCLAELDALVEELGTGSLVHWPGYVADEELRALHAGAVACVLPSECEGFGLPAVEAAAAGTCVVATTQSPLPRLLEGGGLFRDPGDVEGWAGALGALLEDEEQRRRWARRAREAATALSWEKTAAAVLGLLEETAA